jgi:anti-sigma regulatory factor (Ser/Thr protein kinase)
MTAERRIQAPTQTRLAEFTVPSEQGNERLVISRVADALAGSGLTADRLDRLKTAVAEATMNAIEHGNHNRPEIDVEICVYALPTGVAVTITDHGGDDAATAPVAAPDLDQKLAGLQPPRGWGLFLIQNMVDAADVSTAGGKHTVRLVMHRHDPAAASRATVEGGRDDGQ